MPTRDKRRDYAGEDHAARFVVDLVMFSTLINGVMCAAESPRSNEWKGLNEVSRPLRLYQVIPRVNSHTAQLNNTFVFSTIDRIFQWIFDNKDGKYKGEESREERSFGFGQRFVGHRKRLQFALLPIMYKMGVMTTLLTGLTVFALKGLTIGLILLMFTFGNHFLKHGKHWTSQMTQPIHVHVHSQDKAEKFSKYHEYESEVGIGPWDREEVQEQYTPYSKPYPQQSWDSYHKKYLPHSSEVIKYNPLD